MTKMSGRKRTPTRHLSRYSRAHVPVQLELGGPRPSGGPPDLDGRGTSTHVSMHMSTHTPVAFYRKEKTDRSASTHVCYRHLGTADAMPIARVWAWGRSFLSAGTRVPAQSACRRRCRDAYDYRLYVGQNIERIEARVHTSVQLSERRAMHMSTHMSTHMSAHMSVRSSARSSRP